MAATAIFDSDDGPPPLPPESSICSNGHDDAADLSDHDRLTAVADISESEHALSIDIASLPDTWSTVDDTRTCAAHPKHISANREEHIVDGDQFVIEECEPIVASNYPQHFPVDSESMREGDPDSDHGRQSPTTDHDRKSPTADHGQQSPTADHGRQSPIASVPQNDTNSQAVIMNSMDLKLTEMDDDPDDFGDFATFDDDKHITNSLKPMDTMAAVSTTLPNESGNWASFDQTDTSNATEADNWPAEISFTNIVEPTLPSIDQHRSMKEDEISNLSSLCIDDKLWENVNDEEEETIADECDDACDFIRVFDCCCDNERSPNTTFSDSLNIWMALRIIEDSIALKHQWSSSTTNSVFLAALHMDSNFAKLRQSGLPMFAQQLDGVMLTPAPLAASTSDNNASTLSDICAPKHDTVTLPPSTSTTTLESLSVPPANFDWRNSGLTNPLTGASINATSTILDLDFLTANEKVTNTDGISATLQKDLNAFGLVSGTSSEFKTNSNQPSLLDQLMQKTNVVKRPNLIEPNELSPAALAIYNSLPDLSYMRSNVLSFPIRYDNDIDQQSHK